MNKAIPAIVFQFADEQTARNAMETFEELGYDPSWHDRAAPQPQVAIRVINEDLTSALEIGQAYGGRLLDTVQEQHKAREEEVLAMAYDLGGSNREAATAETDTALVEEGRTDARHEPDAASADQDRLDRTGPEPEIPGSDEGPLYDVSADTYDHFSGDVRA